MSAKKQVLVVEDLGVSEEELSKAIEQSGLDYEWIWSTPDADSDRVEVIINVKQALDRDFIESYPNLKMIVVAFTGYDSVDLKTCEEKGIAVYNVPDYSTHSVAELAVGLTISFLREIPKADRQMKQGVWELKPGLELRGRRVGILGTGKIGLQTARIFEVMGCELMGWSRTEKKEFKELGGKYVSDITDLFREADIISIHLSYNDKTEHIVGKEQLEAMKKTAFIVNTARGPIIDEEALVEALENQKIAGACLDVYAKEPIPENHPLLKLDNCILTPHIAFKTEEALARRAKTTLANIADFENGKTTNQVN